MSIVRGGLIFLSLVLSVIGFVLPAVEIELKPDLLAQLQLQQAAEPPNQLAAKNVRLTIRRGDQSVTVATESLPHAPLKISGWGLGNLSEQQLTPLALAMAAWRLKQAAVSTDLLDSVFLCRGQVKRYSRAVFLIPGLAIGFAFLLYAGRGSRWVSGMVGFMCAAIMAVFCWKMNAFALPVSFGSVRFMEGWWMLFSGYLGLVVASVIGLFTQGRC